MRYSCTYSVNSTLDCVWVWFIFTPKTLFRKERVLGGTPAPELRLDAGRGEIFFNLPGIEPVREVYGIGTVRTVLSLLFWSLCDNATTIES